MTARRDASPTSVRARRRRDRRRGPEQCRTGRGRPGGLRIADLAEWAAGVRPTPGDEELARRALVDTVAGTLAAVDGPDTGWTAGSPAVLRWAAVGHVLDIDDVHLPSSSRVSVVCVPATLACGGGSREYLAAAGVMARLGAALDREHDRAGWDATCTVGAPAAAVAAGLALGLDATALATAMALAVPAASGVQGSCGAPDRPLRVGLAAAAGVRAAHLAAAGAPVDPATLDQWFAMIGGVDALDGPLVPDGLTVKPYPCSDALQRVISAVRLLAPLPRDQIAAIRVHIPQSALQPLIRSAPRTGQEATRSLEYAVAVALLDGFPGLASFTDAAVGRPEAKQLAGLVDIRPEPGGIGILDGDVRITVELMDGTVEHAVLDVPDGHPRRPLSDADLSAKVAGCVGPELAATVLTLGWDDAAALLHGALPEGAAR
ncbi:MAG TPA: MmgE/PrpD family protein [Pseudonocardia sp.]|nr:MmgE/PrpD family protein [Pseudonocardia sp.]